MVVVPGVGKREIAMENAAANRELRDIFNKIREAERAAWAGGLRATAPKAYVELADGEITSLVGRNDTLLPPCSRPIKLSYTGLCRTSTPAFAAAAASTV